VSTRELDRVAGGNFGRKEAYFNFPITTNITNPELKILTNKDLDNSVHNDDEVDCSNLYFFSETNLHMSNILKYK